MRQVYDHAHRLLDYGFVPVVAEPGGKRPLHPKWQELRPTHSDIDEWFSLLPNANLAIHTGASRVSVFDCDTQQARDWCREHLPETPWHQVTPRGGVHIPVYDPEGELPNRLNLFRIGLDLRAKASVIVSSPSYSQERRCHWKLVGELCRPEELPRIPKGIIQVQPQQKPLSLVSPHRRSLMRYISYIHAVSGQGGHNAAFRCACKIADQVEDIREGLAIFLEWNATNAIPPFSEKEASHKIEDAYRRKR